MLTREDVKILSDNVPGNRGIWWHIQVGDDYYIVSAVDLRPSFIPGYRTSETMAFPADASAEVTSWGEVGFVPYKDHWACIDDLLENLGHGDDHSVIDGEVVAAAREIERGGES